MTDSVINEIAEKLRQKASADLLPCPFCGVAPHYVCRPVTGYMPLHEISCENFDCGVGVDVSEIILADAQRLWNTRAEATPSRPGNAEALETLPGQIAAVYGKLDAEDCKWIDREWARMRGYILPTNGTSTLAAAPPAAAGREEIAKFLLKYEGERGRRMSEYDGADAILAIIAGSAVTPQDGWLPIEMAPKDRFILLYCPEDDSRWLAKWQGGEWYGTDCVHGLRRTGQSLHDPDYVTGWFVSKWREVPAIAPDGAK